MHSLHEKRGFAPDLVFEGAVKGAMALMVNCGLTPSEIGEMLETCASAIRTVDTGGERSTH